MHLKIETQNDLFLFIEYLKNSSPDWIAVDTEFHRESTYFAILSLIQIATVSQTWVIDALSVTDLTPLKTILENPQIKKIFHAGDQDWAILKRATGAVTWPFTDTQIMACFAKMEHSSSLDSLVLKLLGTTADKSQQKTNWIIRPLSNKQLEYAADDAAYLAQIYPILEQKLWSLNRSAWIDQEMKLLLKKYRSTQSKDWLKLCFVGCKWPIPFYALGLAKWREKWAKKLDIPRRHVIADFLLDQILRKKNLNHINEENCHPKAYNDLQKTWKNLVFAESHQSPEYMKKLCQMADNHAQIFNPTQKALLKKWKTKINYTAGNLGIPPHYILNKQQLIQMVTGQKRHTLTGWRKEVLKEIKLQ
ncbi:MAG: ribonuclease D [Pseudomonadota bacterium]|jgi:ribonuclease D|nr:hypothetical protein [Alphaproteobacteria bacterium]